MKKYVDEFIGFGPGRTYYPSDSHIDYYKPLKEQVDILREDLKSVKRLVPAILLCLNRIKQETNNFALLSRAT